MKTITAQKPFDEISEALSGVEGVYLVGWGGILRLGLLVSRLEVRAIRGLHSTPSSLKSLPRVFNP